MSITLDMQKPKQTTTYDININGKNIGRVEPYEATYRSDSNWHAIIKLDFVGDKRTTPDYVLIQGYGSTPMQAVENAIVKGMDDADRATKAIADFESQWNTTPASQDDMIRETALRT